MTERTTTETAVMYPAQTMLFTTTNDMAAGFGPSIYFTATDSGASDKVFGIIGAVRGAVDTEGDLVFKAGTAGNEEFMRIDQDGKVGIGTDAPAEMLEVDGNIKLTGVSATYKVTNVLDPTAAQDVATKAYVDAQGGGCYSKCADSGTSAGGATPSCPGGYSSVDTWSERAGYGMSQWQGMNSDAHGSNAYRQCGATGCARTPFVSSITAPHSPTCVTNQSQGSEYQWGTWGAAWNTGYTGGTASATYYNDCTACCAD